MATAGSFTTSAATARAFRYERSVGTSRKNRRRQFRTYASVREVPLACAVSAREPPGLEPAWKDRTKGKLSRPLRVRQACARRTAPSLRAEGRERRNPAFRKFSAGIPRCAHSLQLQRGRLSPRFLADCGWRTGWRLRLQRAGTAWLKAA